MNAPAPTTRPLRRVEYDRLVELGFFADERLELLDGMLVPMSPQGGRHATAVQKLTMALATAVAGRADVRAQLPFAAGDDSEPEPDIAVVLPREYVAEHPRQAFLVIEVAESSARRDRANARLYAAASVPEYWIIDLETDTVEVHRDPAGDTYASVTRHGRGETLRVVALPDVAVPTALALPPRSA